MFKKNRKCHYKMHPYHDALHYILYYSKDGLTTEEVADKLKISDLECEHLLKTEQVLDNLNVNPFTGILIYKTKQNTQPTGSLDEILKKAKKTKIISTMKKLIVTFSSIASFTIVPITFNVSLFPKKPNIDVFDFYIEPSVKKELDRRNTIKRENKMNDLIHRIRGLQLSSVDCEEIWDKNKTCYIEGRLLTKNEVETEINQMTDMINQIKN